MAKKKKEPEPVELQPEPKRTVLTKAKDVVKKNPNASWRTIQLAFYGLMIWGINNAPEYIEKYFETQRAQEERQKTWQIKAETRHQQLLKNDSLIIQLLTSKTKTK